MVGLAASIADERPDFDGPMACADVSDPDLFFPVSRPGSRRYAQEAKPAKLICGGCPVRAECLEYALEAGEEGVWGGTDDDERRELSRQRQGVSA
jgi:WhiB family redox-sensing transcriptional regulator